MRSLKVLTLFSLLNFSALSTSPVFSIGETVDLDLEGTGKTTKVTIPFPYSSHEGGDKFSLIHQGGYKVFDVSPDSREVAMIGPLRPCIGIAVTDGKKLVAFHKHSTSSLTSMGKILQDTLDLSDPQKLYARIFTIKDDVDWKERNREDLHGGKNHIGAVKDIKDFLNEKLAIPRAQIPAHLFNIRNHDGELIRPDGALGRYEFAEVCVAVRPNRLFNQGVAPQEIQFYSIDPFTEDVFGYKGTLITYKEYLGPNYEACKQENPSFNFDALLSYDKIAQTVGYKYQRGVCQTRLDREEDEHYVKFFGKPLKELFHLENKREILQSYNSLNFYPLPNLAEKPSR